ncbi:hypothetical protein BDF14DRAFT_1798941 [Spinellus fusiger]|nr:hypothetical protein BDF14DRAFT_1798941 [Spinellus fusiger]
MTPSSVTLHNANTILSLIGVPSMSPTAQPSLTLDTRKLALDLLQDMQQDIKIRLKRIPLYASVADTLSHHYQLKCHRTHQQLAGLDITLTSTTHALAVLHQSRSESEHRLAEYENILDEARQSAEQRRTKKSKREQQYNHFYFVPVVSRQLEKKYKRALDKNALAEEQVCQIRQGMEVCQVALRDATQQKTLYQKELENAKSQREEIEQQLQAAEERRQHLEKGKQFWTEFEVCQARIVSECLQQIQRIVEQKSKSQNTTGLKERDEWCRVFRMACDKYEACEISGEEQWGDGLVVEFECARCKTAQQGSPLPDKIRSSDLLCRTCYDEIRTSRIVEKKMSAFGEKLGLERPSNPRTGSKSSFLSFGSNRPSSVVEDNKSGMKHKLKAMFYKKPQPTGYCDTPGSQQGSAYSSKTFIDDGSVMI